MTNGSTERIWKRDAQQIHASRTSKTFEVARVQRRIDTWQYKQRVERTYCLGLRSTLCFVFAMVSHDPPQLRSTPFSRLPGSRQERQSLRRSSLQSDAGHHERHERDRHSVTRSDLPPALPLKLQAH